MQKEEMIAVNEFCRFHNIEISLIFSLQEFGLIEVSKIEDEIFVPIEKLKHLEKLVRLYHEMDINLEGIETITYLLQRIDDLQQKIVELKSRLSIYENN